jgi:hypothetical protein
MSSSKPSFLSRLAAWMLRLLLLPAVAFCAAALWFDGPAPPVGAGLLAGAIALAMLWLLFVKRGRAGTLLTLLLLLGVIVWWRSIPPRNDRDWMADVARLPAATVDGDRLLIENLRDFRWRSDTDFDAHWETREYDLSAITGMDLFLCYWGPREIAHTILSWEFSDGEHLAISIETRKELGEEYSALRGFFRQYELYYVVADERDLVCVRTGCRGEEVYLYRLATPPARARAMLLDYIASVNALVDAPSWYNAAVHNCTTSIFGHVYDILGEIPLDGRILRNGRIDEMLYERGIVNTSAPFEALRSASRIDGRPGTEAASRAGIPRAGLPQRPPPPPGR